MGVKDVLTRWRAIHPSNNCVHDLNLASLVIKSRTSIFLSESADEFPIFFRTQTRYFCDDCFSAHLRESLSSKDKRFCCHKDMYFVALGHYCCDYFPNRQRLQSDILHHEPAPDLNLPKSIRQGNNVRVRRVESVVYDQIEFGGNHAVQVRKRSQVGLIHKKCLNSFFCK